MKRRPPSTRLHEKGLTSWDGAVLEQEAGETPRRQGATSGEKRRWKARPSKRDVVVEVAFGPVLTEAWLVHVVEDDAIELKGVVHLADSVEEATGGAKTRR